MKIFEKMPLVRKMITQLVTYLIILLNKKKHKLIATDLHKQQVLYDGAKSIQSINLMPM